MYFSVVKNFDSLASTNLRMREVLNVDPDLPGGLVIRAVDQTAGKGRFDRKWVTPPGQCLTFSALVKLAVPPEYLISLPLVTGVAVAETLKQLNISAKLKWPNDVLVNDRKICGILCETVQTKAATAAVILGVGLNVNLSEEAAFAIDPPATSMRIETGQQYSVPGILDILLDELNRRMTDWTKNGCDSVRQAWLANTDDIGKEVEVQSIGEIYHATIADLGKLGQLVVTDSEGLHREVLEGDVKIIRKQTGE